jgi:hypothetical protein
MHSFVRTSLIATIVLPLAAAGTGLSAQKALDPCTLITKAEAAQILKKPEIAKAQSIASGDDTCGYLGAGFDVHTEVLKSPSGWSATMKKMIQEKKAERVDKIGDEAAFVIDGNRDYSMIARKGERMVNVTIFRDNATLAEAKPKLVQLLTLAVSKLR